MHTQVQIRALSTGVLITAHHRFTGGLSAFGIIYIGYLLWELPRPVPVIVWPTLFLSCVAAFWLLHHELEILTDRPTDTLYRRRRFRFQRKAATQTVRMSAVRRVRFQEVPFGWRVVLDLGDSEWELAAVDKRRDLDVLTDCLRRELGLEPMEKEEYTVVNGPDQVVITMVGYYDKPKRLEISKAAGTLTVDGRTVRSVATVWLRPYTYEGSYHRWQVGIDGTGTFLQDVVGIFKERVVASGIREESMKSLAESLAGSLGVGFHRRALYEDSGTW